MKLEIKNISRSFDHPGGPFFGKKEKTQAVKNVSFFLHDQESLGLVGESGSGKTTVAKIVTGFLSPDQGSVLFEGKSISTFNQIEKAKKVQMVFQDPFSSLNPKLHLKTQLSEGIEIFKSLSRQVVSRDDDLSQAEQLMTDVGLSPDFLSRYPHQLSGGQRQRFAIARALSLQPELLIADEPVSSLDLSVQAQIINLLNSLKEKRNFMMLVISHDLAVIANLCQRALVMKAGEVVEEGEVQNILTAPKSDYARKLVQATPTV